MLQYDTTTKWIQNIFWIRYYTFEAKLTRPRPGRGQMLEADANCKAEPLWPSPRPNFWPRGQSDLEALTSLIKAGPKIFVPGRSQKKNFGARELRGLAYRAEFGRRRSNGISVKIKIWQSCPLWLEACSSVSREGRQERTAPGGNQEGAAKWGWN